MLDLGCCRRSLRQHPSFCYSEGAQRVCSPTLMLEGPATLSAPLRCPGAHPRPAALLAAGSHPLGSLKPASPWPCPRGSSGPPLPRIAPDSGRQRSHPLQNPGHPSLRQCEGRVSLLRSVCLKKLLFSVRFLQTSLVGGGGGDSVASFFLLGSRSPPLELEAVLEMPPLLHAGHSWASCRALGPCQHRSVGQGDGLCSDPEVPPMRERTSGGTSE